MRILVLSCNTGGGHNSAAAAMKEYFDSIGVFCEVKDALAFESQKKSDFISSGHVFIYKHTPRLFGSAYRFMEEHPTKPDDISVIYEIFKKGATPLYEYIAENCFDTVICTHVWACMILKEVRKKYETSFRSYVIATDYTCAPGTEELDADLFFLPHVQMIPEYLSSGLPHEKLVPAGIPVKRAFYEKLPSNEAKRLLGLPTDKRVVLMMCGSMGCGPLRELGTEIAKALPQESMLVVICGSNEKLLEKFEKMTNYENLLVVGFTKQIALYMDAADIILTKPGGLSSTEAATKRVPTIFIDAVPGCETRNIEFFTRNGLSITAETVEKLTALVLELLADQGKRAAIKEKMAEFFPEYTAKTIGEKILSEARLKEIVNERS